MLEVGEKVKVRKHSSMACAVVSLKDTRVRMALVPNYTELTISNIRVRARPHIDKTTKVDVPTDNFIAWGGQDEKTEKLSEHEFKQIFDCKYQEVLECWRSDTVFCHETSTTAEDAAQQQKMLEENDSSSRDLLCQKFHALRGQIVPPRLSEPPPIAPPPGSLSNPVPEHILQLPIASEAYMELERF